MYIHTYDCVQTVHELPLLPNDSAVEHFYTNRERCEVLTGYLSMGRRPGEYVTLDRTLNSLRFKQEEAAAPVTATFSSLPQTFRRPLLEK